MAKKAAAPPEKEVRVKYPSQFGSHSSMIDQEATEKLSDPNRVVIKDELGLYETERFYLDSNRADPNRYRTSRLGRLFSNKEKSQ